MALTRPVVDGCELDAVRRVLESGWLAEGTVTTELEQKVARYVGSRYAVAVCNCTVALTLCLKAYNAQGEVLVPDFTHSATAQAVLNAGCTPVLADVLLDTYNISLRKHDWLDTIIPVSWGGNPMGVMWGTPPPFPIEDAACSLGSALNGVKTGSQITTCFSFHPRKLVTCGEGGIVTTNNEEIAERIRELKNFGAGGGNYKFNDISAAIMLVQMDKLDNIITRRVDMARVYNELLSGVDDVQVPFVHPDCKHTFQTYAVYLEKANRDKTIQRLAKHGIEVQVGAYALHLLPQFQKLKRIGKLTNSTKLHHRLLALPMAHNLTEEDQQYVVDCLKEVVK